MPHTKILHNLRETAHLLGVPISWLEREADAGRIPFLRVGKKRMFDLEVLRSTLAEMVKREGVSNG